MKKIFLLLPLIALVLLVSGCVGGPGGSSELTGSGNGVIIEKLTTEPIVDDDAQSFQVRLNIKNNGERLATNVWPELGGAASSFNPNLKFPSVTPIDELYGIKKEPDGRIIDGESEPVTFELTPFNVVQDTDFKFRGHVWYQYSTAASRKINIATRDELNRLRDATGSVNLAFDELTTVSKGPLQVDIKSASIARVSASKPTVRVSIYIKNSGEGLLTPKYGGSGFERDNLVNIRVESQELSSSGNGCNSGTIELFKGQDTTLTCDFIVNDIPETVSEKLLQVILDYNYRFDLPADPNAGVVTRVVDSGEAQRPVAP